MQLWSAPTGLSEWVPLPPQGDAVVVGRPEDAELCELLGRMSPSARCYLIGQQRGLPDDARLRVVANVAELWRHIAYAQHTRRLGWYAVPAASAQARALLGQVRALVERTATRVPRELTAPSHLTQLLDLALRSARLEPGSRFLDLGCGEATLYDLLVAGGVAELYPYTGVDVDVAAGRARHPELALVQASWPDAAARLEPAEVVVAAGLLDGLGAFDEHLPRLWRLTRRLLFIEVPALRAPDAATRRAGGRLLAPVGTLEAIGERLPDARLVLATYAPLEGPGPAPAEIPPAALASARICFARRA